MAKNTKLSIAFYEKYLMTVEEAAVYFHIGYKKMRSLINILMQKSVLLQLMLF